MSVDPIGLLLLGGIAVIALGVIAGIVVLVVVLVRRSRRAEPPSRMAAPEAGGIAALADSSPFATYQVPGAESSESSSLSAAFVAGPRQPAPTVQGATGSSESASGSVGGAGVGASGGEGSGVDGSGASSEAAAPLAPTVPAWHDIVGSPLDAEPFQYTTGSFAAPSPLAAAVGVPLANPWAGTGPQDDSLPPRPAPAVVPEPAPAAEPVPPREPAPAVDPAPAIVPPPAAEPAPVIAPPPGRIAPPPGRSEPPVVVEAPASAADVPPQAAAPVPVPPTVPEDAPVPEDDGPTVVIAGRGTAPAPWLLILDTGDRIGIEADSVVLGRRPAPIEHGVPGIVVPDPTKTLSKVHARLDRVGDQWTITDLGSTNGTAIIEAGGRERLLPAGGSDVVRGRFVLGEVGLVLVRNPEAVR